MAPPMKTGRSASFLLLAGLLVGLPGVAEALPAPDAPRAPRSRARLLAQVALPDAPSPSPEPAAPPAAGPSSYAPPSPGARSVGAEGSSRSASSRPAPSPAPSTENAPDDRPLKPRPRDNLLGFGLMLGQPSGLTLRARFLDRHAVVGSVGWDFLYRSVALSLDYRFTFFQWDFLRYDATVGFFAGGGVRLGTFEPVAQYRRESWIAPGLRTPVGATLRLRPLPVELALVVSPLGFDVKELALTFPRWRPEATLELRVDFPWAPL
jgi:hypothetical protein